MLESCAPVPTKDVDNLWVDGHSRSSIQQLQILELVVSHSFNNSPSIVNGIVHLEPVADEIELIEAAATEDVPVPESADSGVSYPDVHGPCLSPLFVFDVVLLNTLQGFGRRGRSPDQEDEVVEEYHPVLLSPARDGDSLLDLGCAELVLPEVQIMMLVGC